MFRCSDVRVHHRPNHIVHISNNITFFPNIFGPRLVDPADGEPGDADGRLSGSSLQMGKKLSGSRHGACLSMLCALHSLKKPNTIKPPLSRSQLTRMINKILFLCRTRGKMLKTRKKSLWELSFNSKLFLPKQYINK